MMLDRSSSRMFLKYYAKIFIDRTTRDSRGGQRKRFEYIEFLRESITKSVISTNCQPLLTKQTTSLLSSLIRLALLSLFIAKCTCFKYYVPALGNFELCSKGFRVSVYSVKSFNESSGLTVYFHDALEDRFYSVNIRYLNHNWLPEFESANFASVSKNKRPTEPLNTHTIKRQNELYDYQSYTVFFKEYFYFFKSENIESNFLIGQTNELIGCPQLLCMNAYTDGAFYHEQERKYYFFRGPYYYSIRKNDSTFNPMINLIPTRFFGVPMHIDSATYLKTDFYPSGYAILFTKEDKVFVYSKERSIAVEVSQREFFWEEDREQENNYHFSYINSLTYLSPNKLLVCKHNSFFMYKVYPNYFWTNIPVPLRQYAHNETIERTNDIRFIKEGTKAISVKTNSTYIEKADDTITLFEEDKLMFIYKWKIYLHSLSQFTSLISKETEGKVINPKDEIEEQQFRRLYLETLPVAHSQREWYKLISSVTPYDASLIYVTIGIIIAFLIVGIMLFGIFVTIYVSSLRKLEFTSFDQFEGPSSVQKEASTSVNEKSDTSQPSEPQLSKRRAKKGLREATRNYREKSNKFKRKTVNSTDKEEPSEPDEEKSEHVFKVIRLTDPVKKMSSKAPSDHSATCSDYNPLSSFQKQKK